MNKAGRITVETLEGGLGFHRQMIAGLEFHEADRLAAALRLLDVVNADVNQVTSSDGMTHSFAAYIISPYELTAQDVILALQINQMTTSYDKAIIGLKRSAHIHTAFKRVIRTVFGVYGDVRENTTYPEEG